MARKSTRSTRSRRQKERPPTSKIYVYKNDVDRDESENPCAYRMYIILLKEDIELLLENLEEDKNGNEIAKMRALTWRSTDTDYVLGGVVFPTELEDDDDDDDDEEEPPRRSSSRTQRSKRRQ